MQQVQQVSENNALTVKTTFGPEISECFCSKINKVVVMDTSEKKKRVGSNQDSFYIQSVNSVLWPFRKQAAILV